MHRDRRQPTVLLLAPGPARRSLQSLPPGRCSPTRDARAHFLMPPVASGPPAFAFCCIALSASASAFCFALNALSSSSSSPLGPFFAALSGCRSFQPHPTAMTLSRPTLSLPPCRPDMLLVVVVGGGGAKARPRSPSRVRLRSNLAGGMRSHGPGLSRSGPSKLGLQLERFDPHRLRAIRGPSTATGERPRDGYRARKRS